jgi:hypothetical protein
MLSEAIAWGTVDSTHVERLSIEKGTVMIMLLEGHPTVYEPKASAARFGERA